MSSPGSVVGRRATCFVGGRRDEFEGLIALFDNGLERRNGEFGAAVVALGIDAKCSQMVGTA